MGLRARLCSSFICVRRWKNDDDRSALACRSLFASLQPRMQMMLISGCPSSRSARAQHNPRIYIHALALFSIAYLSLLLPIFPYFTTFLFLSASPKAYVCVCIYTGGGDEGPFARRRLFTKNNKMQISFPRNLNFSREKLCLYIYAVYVYIYF